MAEGNTGSVLGVDAGMAARALVGALLIAIIAAIIVTLVSLAMFLRAPIYEPTARVWVQRELRIGPPSPGPEKRLTETTQAMARLAASRPVAIEARRSLGLQAGFRRATGELGNSSGPGHDFHRPNLPRHRPKEGHPDGQRLSQGCVRTPLRGGRQEPRGHRLGGGPSAPGCAGAQTVEERTPHAGGGVGAVRGPHPCHASRVETLEGMFTERQHGQRSSITP